MINGEAGAAGAGAGSITVEALGAVQGDAFRALLPAEIQSKPYIKEINTFGDLVKKFDGAQSLLGQRNVPELTAPDDQWEAFHSKTRPEKSDAYQVPQIEGVPPEFVKKAAESKMFRELLHKAGASPYQAKVLLSGFLSEVYKAQVGIDQESARATAAKDAAFEKMAGELFGGQKDVILANGKKFLAANIPDNVKPFLDSLDDKSLAIVLAATDGMAKKYTGEDPFRGGGGGGGGGETKDQLIGQMQAIMKDPAYADPLKDRVKNTELNQKMEVIRGKLKKLQGGL